MYTTIYNIQIHILPTEYQRLKTPPPHPLLHLFRTPLFYQLTRLRRFVWEALSENESDWLHLLCIISRPQSPFWTKLLGSCIAIKRGINGTWRQLIVYIEWQTTSARFLAYTVTPTEQIGDAIGRFTDSPTDPVDTFASARNVFSNSAVSVPISALHVQLMGGRLAL